MAQRATLDGEIAAAAHEFAGWEPEQIVWRVDLLAAEALETERLGDDPDVDEILEEPDRPGDVLVLQPRIDGTGGKLFGDYHDPLAALASVPGVLAPSQARSLRCSGDADG